MIKLRVRLKRPMNWGVWTSYLDIYIFGKKRWSIFMNGHPELIDHDNHLQISEKDIIKECSHYKHREDAICFREGARWYKEELRNRISGLKVKIW